MKNDTSPGKVQEALLHRQYGGRCNGKLFALYSAEAA